jgi:hypothetical protein
MTQVTPAQIVMLWHRITLACFEYLGFKRV